MRFPIAATTLGLMASTASHAAELNVNCTGGASDATLLQSTIAGSAAGDEIRIHGQCLVVATIVLSGDRSYVGDSRTGTVLLAASSTLPAILASDSWAADSASTGNPFRLAHLSLQATCSRSRWGGRAAVLFPACGAGR